MKSILFLFFLLFALPLTPPSNLHTSRDIASIVSKNCFNVASELIKESSEAKIINRMESGKISNIADIPEDHATNAYIVSFSISNQKAIFKPQLNLLDSPYSYISNSRAEHLAYLIDRKFGFNLVPPTTIRKEVDINGKLKWGSIQHYIERAKSVKDIAIAHNHGNEIWDILGTIIKPLNQNNVYKLALFDFLIENGDRHPGNCLVSPVGKLVAIDHGGSFTGVGAHWKTFSQRREQIDAFLKTDSGKQILKQLQELNLDEFYDYLSDYLAKEDAVRVIERVQALLFREEVKKEFGLSLEFVDEQLEQQIINMAEEDDWQENLWRLGHGIKIDKEMRTMFHMTLEEYASNLKFRERKKKKKLKELINKLQNVFDLRI